MAEKTVSVAMDGYWLENGISQMPDHSGVYCAYECFYNRSANTVSLHKLIYIGESENVRTRIVGHDKWAEWRRHVRQGYQLCFSTGYVAPVDRPRVEAAMIFKHKPPVNTEYKNDFPFDKTTIYLSGKTALLVTAFAVQRTIASLSGIPSLGYMRRIRFPN